MTAPALRWFHNGTATVARLGRALRTALSLTMYPVQPYSVSYANPPTAAVTGQHARPGGLVIADRQTTGHQVFKDISAAGGCVLAYFDAIITNQTGTYHALLNQSNAYGAAVPAWPGPIVANGSGNINDFRPSSPMHAASLTNPAWTKLEAVLEKLIADNPHIGGIFADDLGTRSYFAGASGSVDTWGNMTATEKQAYRDGAILVAQTLRRVCTRHGIIFVVNGSWEAGTLTTKGGGYPDLAVHGCSIADGGMRERNPRDAFAIGYVRGAQWATDPEAVGNANRVMLVLAQDETTRQAWVAGADAPYVVYQPTGGYVEAGTGGIAGHATGLPSKVRF